MEHPIDTTAKQLEQLETSLHAAGHHGRSAIQVDSFYAYLAPEVEPHLSFASPVNAPSDWQAAIKALREIFRKHKRTMRLEYFDERYPELSGYLERAGLACESRAPVMTLDSNTWRSQVLSEITPSEVSLPGHYVHLNDVSLQRVKAFLQGQAVAFQLAGEVPEDAELSVDDASGLDWLPHLMQGMAAGTVLGAGLEQGGQFVSGAIIQLGGNIGELAGVWTYPQKRKQGLAFALCQRLLASYFDAGYELCWLSAAEGAQRLYERLGFKRCGTQLNYSLPHA
jgi:ribosomal protein S18 acetylase RimI-like enzyme